MKKSQWTMELIGTLQEAIEHDLQLYEADKREGFIFLKYAEEVGMIAPLDWIRDYPAWSDKWHKFMSGQSFCSAGFYVTNVSKFLRMVERDLGEETCGE